MISESFEASYIVRGWVEVGSIQTGGRVGMN